MKKPFAAPVLSPVSSLGKMTLGAAVSQAPTPD